MIRIAVDMWPGGDRTREFPLAEIRIANVSDLADISDYQYAVVRKSRGRKSRSLAVRTGKIEGFPRNKLNVLDLLYRVLDKEVGERNGLKNRRPKLVDGITGKVINKEK